MDVNAHTDVPLIFYLLQVSLAYGKAANLGRVVRKPVNLNPRLNVY